MAESESQRTSQRKRKKRKKRLPRTSSLPRFVAGCLLRSTRPLDSSERRLLLQSARCLVRKWIHVHDEATEMLDIFPTRSLFLAVTSPVFVRQFMKAFGTI